jgi:hypothetical protein
MFNFKARTYGRTKDSYSFGRGFDHLPCYPYRQRTPNGGNLGCLRAQGLMVSRRVRDAELSEFDPPVPD